MGVPMGVPGWAIRATTRAGGREAPIHSRKTENTRQTQTNTVHSPQRKGDDMIKRNGCLIAFLIWIALVGLTAIGQQLLAALT
jgi:hypothetical protein